MRSNRLWNADLIPMGTPAAGITMRAGHRGLTFDPLPHALPMDVRLRRGPVIRTAGVQTDNIPAATAIPEGICEEAPTAVPMIPGDMRLREIPAE